MDQEAHLRPDDAKDLFALISRALQGLQDAVATVISHARQKAVQGFVLFFVVTLLFLISAFLYGSFYYSYMPLAAFHAPVHYYYRTDCESPASFLCSYPVANVSLMRNKKHVLTFGQPYEMSLQLEMPDSPTNQELGMFMIRTTCFSRGGRRVASSARSGVLRYRSDLLRYLGTLLFLPAFLTGVAEQKQVLQVELFSDFTDDPYFPSMTAVIEILSSKVQIYSSQLLIHAHFTGMRYLLFNFPLLSTMVGVSTNFIFLNGVFALCYVRLVLRVDWRAGQMASDGLPSDGDENTKNHQEDAAGTERLLSPSDDSKKPEPSEAPPTSANEEVPPRRAHGQVDSKETEAA
ncbi:seipin isoform X2 [Gasterosteus aculeatus]|uniref:Seipin n=1 Tax=Gasterosteus aculeatus aculeatus TaxID=481459 RepID=A0AAQ4REL8_GASAC|nr:seipin-like isoform X2 [Gasterosteus aculeatus aculeatus]